MMIPIWLAEMVNYFLFRQHALHSVDMECVILVAVISNISEFSSKDDKMGQDIEKSVYRIWDIKGAILERGSHS